MNTKLIAAVLLSASVLAVVPGCAVSRDQSTVGEYIDDAAITASVKAKFVENKAVDASAVSVETLKGTVLLSGFAKSDVEKSAAESIARGTKGVKEVKNQLVIRS